MLFKMMSASTLLQSITKNILKFNNSLCKKKH